MKKDSEKEFVQLIFGGIVAVIIAVFVASNYEMRIIDNTPENTLMVATGKSIGKIAFDFKFLGKHVVIINK